MNKRSFRLDAFFLAVVLCLLGGKAVSAVRNDTPNIVMIISDDQGWTDFGFMGHPQIHTPHLDKLASQSLTFRHGYVPSSLCCPSLASMISGLYPHQTGITGNEPPKPAGVSSDYRKDPGYQKQVQELVHYMDRLPALPRELASRGYVSFQTGKWWQGHFRTGGFTEGMSKGDPEHGGRHGDEGLAIGRKTMQPIYDFIGRATTEKKPFFLWYAPMMPHQAHNPPQRILQKYKKLIGSSAGLNDKSPVTLEIAKYWAMCEWFDETCGDLLGYLDKNDLADNTIVVFLVDNGWIQDPNADKPREDSKLSQYDGGVRTPIMIRWPGKVKPRMDDTPVSSIDIAPTLLKSCGITPKEDLEGVNLLDKSAVRKRKSIFGECFLHNAVDIHAPEKNLAYRWCVMDGWKLILPNTANVKSGNKPGRGVDVELYHLTQDPFEETNLMGKEPKRVVKMKKQIDEWWPAGR